MILFFLDNVAFLDLKIRVSIKKIRLWIKIYKCPHLLSNTLFTHHLPKCHPPTHQNVPTLIFTPPHHPPPLPPPPTLKRPRNHPTMCRFIILFLQPLTQLLFEHVLTLNSFVQSSSLILFFIVIFFYRHLLNTYTKHGPHFNLTLFSPFDS